MNLNEITGILFAIFLWIIVGIAMFIVESTIIAKDGSLPDAFSPFALWFVMTGLLVFVGLGYYFDFIFKLKRRKEKKKNG